jgi:hypothetical protein
VITFLFLTSKSPYKGAGRSSWVRCRCNDDGSVRSDNHLGRPKASRASIVDCDPLISPDDDVIVSWITVVPYAKE